MTTSIASENQGSISSWVMIHPPGDIIRVRVEGSYTCSYDRDPGSLTHGFARFEIDTSSQVIMTSSLDPATFIAAPENGVASDTFWVEWERDDPGHEWPVDMEEAEGPSPPTNQVAPNLRAYCYSTEEGVAVSVVFSVEVVEMETEGGTTYTY